MDETLVKALFAALTPEELAVIAAFFSDEAWSEFVNALLTPPTNS